MPEWLAAYRELLHPSVAYTFPGPTAIQLKRCRGRQLFVLEERIRCKGTLDRTSIKKKGTNNVAKMRTGNRPTSHEKLLAYKRNQTAYHAIDVLAHSSASNRSTF